MAIDKNRAIEMRLAGATYPEISAELPCSLDWCKKNLQGIGSKTKTKNGELVTEIRQIGRTPKGITDSQVWRLVKDAYPLLDGKHLGEMVTDIKKQARRGCKDVIIRPVWLTPEEPMDCLETIMVMGQQVHELLQGLAQRFCEEFDLDTACQKSVIYELTVLSAGEGSKLMPMGLLNHCSYLERIANTLITRNSERFGRTAFGPQSFIETDKKTYPLEEEVKIILEEVELPY
jgi:hypothetical protein